MLENKIDALRYRKYIFISILILLFQLHAVAQEYKLDIKCDENISKKILKSYTGIKGDSTRIENNLKLLINDLHAEGYLSASIDSVRYFESTVSANLFRGDKYTWDKLDLSILEPKLLDNLNIKKKDFDIVNIISLQQLEKSIISYYENSGYPFVNVKLDTLQIEDSKFKASVVVNKGDYYFLDSIIIKGDAKISHNYIKKVLQIEQGIPFNQNRIDGIKNTIRDISFISEIKPAEIEFREDAVDLYLYLQKKKANMFNGIIGFLPESQNSQGKKSDKILITGELKLNLINSFGRGEEIFLNWEKLESSSQKLDLGIVYPYIFKTNLGIDADFGLYKKDSTFLSLNMGMGLQLFLTGNNYIKAYYRFKSSNKIGSKREISTSVNYADVKSNIIGASYYMSELDYKYNPRKGLKLNIFAGAGFKNLSDTKNAADSLNIEIDNKTLEVEAGLNLNLYLPIYNNFVFHFENVTRYLDQFVESGKESVLFENELYRFGGARTLRGFDENIFYASVYSMQNVEIKYIFEQNSAFYIFWNGAYYYKNVLKEVTEDFPWGFGVGLDFETRAGIFTLSYAIGKQFDNPVEIKTAKIHFGYISRF